MVSRCFLACFPQSTRNVFDFRVRVLQSTRNVFRLLSVRCSRFLGFRDGIEMVRDGFEMVRDGFEMLFRVFVRNLPGTFSISVTFSQSTRNVC